MLPHLVQRSAVASRRGVENVGHQRRVEAESAPHDHRLERRDRAGGGDVVVQRLDRVAGAKRTGKESLLPQRFQHRAHLPERGSLAAGHDCQRPGARAIDAPGHRRVQQFDSAPGELRTERAGRHRVGRAHCLAVGQHGDEDARAARDLGRPMRPRPMKAIAARFIWPPWPACAISRCGPARAWRVSHLLRLHRRVLSRATA